LEVRRCGDGHPPVTERERVIRLNGIGGVIFQNPDRKFDPGFFTLTTLVILSEAKNLGFNSLSRRLRARARDVSLCSTGQPTV
jgi:hypothetical protein